MKTRVLFLITRLIVGGAQETVIITADLIDKERWEPDVVCGPQTGPEGNLIDVARDRGISLSIEPSLVREIHPIQDIKALIRLTRLTRKNRYTIVHTHSSKAGIIGRWAAWLGGAPVIVHTVHGWGHHEFQTPLVRRIFIMLEKLTLRITDRLIAVTPLNVEKGVADGIGTARHYSVIRSGIELDKFGHPHTPPDVMKSALGIPPGIPVVGTVTRLSPQKAPADFIQAAAIIHKEYPDVRFVMVGDGPLRKEVENLADDLDLTEVLLFTGLRRDVPELMATFDVFVISSLWEGLPRVLPQAMATGLPIVATSIDGNVEAVVDGVNGFLVAPNEPAEMALRIRDLLLNSQLAIEMGKNGSERAEEFSDKLMVSKIENLYLELMQQKDLNGPASL